MADSLFVQIPQTLQELDEAVKRYHTTDLTGDELYQQWQAIRDASLECLPIETDNQPVPGTDSY
jgi:hypothetical protein